VTVTRELRDDDQEHQETLNTLLEHCKPEIKTVDDDKLLGDV